MDSIKTDLAIGIFIGFILGAIITTLVAMQLAYGNPAPQPDPIPIERKCPIEQPAFTR